MKVIAHRGASAHAAEHTREAYDRAVELGADALELDVRSSADGTFVVLHDETLRRTTGDPRPVALVPDDELFALDGAPLRLSTVLTRYAGVIDLLVELKVLDPRDDERFAGLVRDLPGVVVQSFDHAILRRLRVDAPLAALLSRAPRAALRRIARFTSAVHPCAESVDLAFVAAAHALGLQVVPYTVNERAEIERLRALGVDGVITDRPELVAGGPAALAATA